MIARECFVIQRKGRDGKTYTDWVNPFNGRVDYETHDHAVKTLLRRADAIDYRIVRRVWTYVDFAV